MKTLLLLEDKAERIAAFEKVVSELGSDWRMQVWRDAPTMLAECQSYFAETHLISLDHDLCPQPGATVDPGTGLEVAKLRSSHLPFCPIIIHSTNVDRAWSMHNEPRFGGWAVECFGPIGDDWCHKLWLPKARELLASSPRKDIFKCLPDHKERMRRALLSLEGLAIADAVGEMLACRQYQAPSIIDKGLPAGPWFRPDDSEMAISIAESLKLYGHIHQGALARRFAWRYERDPDRGYGSVTRAQLNEITRGGDWWLGAANAFGGQGSMGNGGYFADDLKRVASEACASAAVTHAHPEGVAGTISVAIAAAVAWQSRNESKSQRARQMFEAVLKFTPESKVRRGILIASQTPASVEVESVSKALGNGSLVTAPDTVPFALWSAASHFDNYVNALKQTILHWCLVCVVRVWRRGRVAGAGLAAERWVDASGRAASGSV